MEVEYNNLTHYDYINNLIEFLNKELLKTNKKIFDLDIDILPYVNFIKQCDMKIDELGDKYENKKLHFNSQHCEYEVNFIQGTIYLNACINKVIDDSDKASEDAYNAILSECWRIEYNKDKASITTVKKQIIMDNPDLLNIILRNGYELHLYKYNSGQVITYIPKENHILVIYRFMNKKLEPYMTQVDNVSIEDYSPKNKFIQNARDSYGITEFGCSEENFESLYWQLRRINAKNAIRYYLLESMCL